MLPILLTILKILGWVILALLGLITLILLIILLVPVRYSLSGSFHERLRAKAKITWFLHGVSVTVTYEDKPDIAVKLLGRRLFQGGGWEEKPEEEPEDGWEDPEAEREEGDSRAEAKSRRESKERQLEKSKGHRPEEGAGETGPTRKPEVGEETRQRKEVSRQARRRQKPDSRNRKGRQSRAERQPDCGSSEPWKDWTGDPGESSETSGGFGRFRQTFDSLKENWDQLWEYKEKVSAFVKDPENQKTAKLLLFQAKKLIRHLLPTKVQGQAVFGFDDPATTGKVLSGLSILYAWYGDKIQIVPVFDQKILEVDGSIKGRARLGTLLAAAVRVFLNKNFRRLIRRFLRSGGK